MFNPVTARFNDPDDFYIYVDADRQAERAEAAQAEWLDSGDPEDICPLDGSTHSYAYNVWGAD